MKAGQAGRNLSGPTVSSKETAEREEVGQTRWKRERKSQKERPWKPTRGKPVRVRVRVRVRVSVRVNVVVFVVL